MFSCTNPLIAATDVVLQNLPCLGVISKKTRKPWLFSIWNRPRKRLPLKMAWFRPFFPLSSQSFLGIPSDSIWINCINLPQAWKMIQNQNPKFHGRKSHVFFIMGLRSKNLMVQNPKFSNAAIGFSHHFPEIFAIFSEHLGLPGSWTWCSDLLWDKKDPLDAKFFG